MFAMNDLSAAGVIAVLRESGRTMPGDVAVIGFDDVEMAIHTDPPLTTIRQPTHEMGATAAGLLLAALAGAPLPAGPTVLPTNLVVRTSTVA